MKTARSAPRGRLPSPAVPSARLRGQHQLAGSAALHQVVEGIGGLLQRIGLADAGSDLALVVQLEQVLEVTVVGLGVAVDESAPEHADDGAALEQRQVG